MSGLQVCSGDPPRGAGRHTTEVSAHIWFPKSRVRLSSRLPTHPGNDHTRERKRKNLGVVQFLAPDLLDSHPLGLPWAWQVCQHPEKYRKSDTVGSTPTYFHSLSGVQLSLYSPRTGRPGYGSGGSRETMRQPKLHVCFLHPVSLPTCWQHLPSSFHYGGRSLSCSRKVPGPGTLHMLLVHQVPGLQGTHKLCRAEL